MKKKLFIGMLVVTIFLGLGLGFFLFVPNIKASTVNWGASPNEDPSPVYDEVWQADTVCYSTATGYNCIEDLTNNLGDIDGAVAGRMVIPEASQVDSDGNNYLDVPYVEYQPKARVTKWKVQGHIHFP